MTKRVSQIKVVSDYILATGWWKQCLYGFTLFKEWSPRTRHLLRRLLTVSCQTLIFSENLSWDQKAVILKYIRIFFPLAIIIHLGLRKGRHRFRLLLVQLGLHQICTGGYKLRIQFRLQLKLETRNVNMVLWPNARTLPNWRIFAPFWGNSCPLHYYVW